MENNSLSLGHLSNKQRARVGRMLDRLAFAKRNDPAPGEVEVVASCTIDSGGCQERMYTGECSCSQVIRTAR